ncbi:hypothetical protein [Bacillus sp. AFS041924]|uniref:hypothetical protein n=1 Tax=Bacillus sp. AFS041924 TaxID=2033503 RepID=UPI000BFD1BA8|nr:hypothetical protein [Bacillus sp. AFS041924]PGS52644.1 hypothetical protein COC46_09310 [Bacillus sp. AFS041924]
MQNRTEKTEKQTWISKKFKKLLIGSVTLSGGLLLATTFSFADTNLPAAMTAWTSQQTKQASDYIIGMTEAESTKQKARLIQEVQKNAKESAEEIQKYATQKSLESQEELQKYGDQLIQQIDSKNEKDVQEAKAKIDKIIQNAEERAKEEMNQQVPKVNSNNTNKNETSNSKNDDSQDTNNQGQASEEGQQ